MQLGAICASHDSGRRQFKNLPTQGKQAGKYGSKAKPACRHAKFINLSDRLLPRYQQQGFFLMALFEAL